MNFQLLSIETKSGRAANAEEAEDNVELRFDRTLRIKQALLAKADLAAEVKNPLFYHMF